MNSILKRLMEKPHCKLKICSAHKISPLSQNLIHDIAILPSMGKYSGLTSLCYVCFSVCSVCITDYLECLDRTRVRIVPAMMLNGINTIIAEDVAS